MSLTDEASKLFEHIKNLDYPRNVGTEGEKKAAEYIGSTFEKYGYEPKYENYYYSLPKPSRTILLMVLFSGFLILTLLNLLYFQNIEKIVISLIFFVIPIAVIIVYLKIDSFFKRLILRNVKFFSKMESKKAKTKTQIESKNIIAEYIPPEFKKHIYIACHYDSTSLRLSTKSIILISMIGALSFFAYIILYFIEFVYILLNAGFFTLYWFIFMPFFIISLIFLNLLLFVRGFRTNVSHGAIDNGTGVAIVLELSKIIREISPKLKVTFAAFSAEEIGFIGSSYHYYKNKESFDPDLHVISIDMIGEVPPLTYVKTINPVAKLKTDEKFNKDLEEIAKNNEIKFKGVKFFYPGSDILDHRRPVSGD